MHLLRLSAISVALFGSVSALADEADDPAIERSRTAASAPQPLWSEFTDESSLLSQAQAASAAHNRRVAKARGVSLETIDATLMADAGTPAAENGNCKHLPLPGSRFMTERCFYETPGEAALNDYQFRREIQENIEQQQRNYLEIAGYSLGYRRSLAEQQRMQ